MFFIFSRIKFQIIGPKYLIEIDLFNPFNEILNADISYFYFLQPGPQKLFEINIIMPYCDDKQ